jgi:hypothetical protein
LLCVVYEWFVRVIADLESVFFHKASVALLNAFAHIHQVNSWLNKALRV